VLFDLSREVNSLLDGDSSLRRAELEAIEGFYTELGGQILGLTFQGASSGVAGLEARLLELLVQTRSQLRRAQRWELADGIRTGLAEMGVALEDGPEGTTWRHERPD
jgi:cysteinyl-tRNA synthetase